MVAYARRDIRGGAVQTTITAGITNSDGSCTITATTGWPTGSPGNFFVVIDPGNSAEEKIECSAQSGGVVTFATRGADGSTAIAHSAGATIYPIGTARDLDEANLLVSKTLLLATAQGQIPVVDAANSFAMLQAKTSGQILQGNGTTLVSNAVSGDVTIDSSGVTAIGASKVTSNMIVNGTIVAADINASAAITGSQLSASAAITGTQLAAATIPSSRMALAKVRLRRAANQTIDASAAVVNISWDTEDADASGYIAVTSPTLTVPTGLDGWHLITCLVIPTGSTSAVSYLDIVAGGVTYQATNSVAVASQRPTLTVLAYLAAADTIVADIRNGASDTYQARLNVVNLGA